jgi:GNAT superfamily N-acetyltransferase
VSLRAATVADIDSMHRVRVAVRENRLLVPSRIGPEDYRRMLERDGRGWVYEVNDEVVGFAIADGTRRNIWALFVAPGFERRGIGRSLHDATVDWLLGMGPSTIWLTTAPNTRAERFYCAAGWSRIGLEANGDVRFEMMRVAPRVHEPGDNMNEPQVTQTHRAFLLACAVKANIRASAAIIWSLLTDAQGYSRWNSTISGVEGQIREGERLRLHVPGTERTFTPRVSGVVPSERMTWTGGFAPLFKGERTFVLTPRDSGSTDFTMEERFSGLILPLVKESLPDFGPVFERFANDLKREAERATR